MDTRSSASQLLFTSCLTRRTRSSPSSAFSVGWRARIPVTYGTALSKVARVMTSRRDPCILARRGIFGDTRVASAPACAAGDEMADVDGVDVRLKAGDAATVSGTGERQSSWLGKRAQLGGPGLVGVRPSAGKLSAGPRRSGVRGTSAVSARCGVDGESESNASVLDGPLASKKTSTALSLNSGDSNMAK